MPRLRRPVPRPLHLGADRQPEPRLHHQGPERNGHGDLLQPRLLGRLPFVHAVHVPADRLQYRRGGQLQLHQQLDQHRNHLPGHDARQGRLPRAGVPGQDRLRPHVRQTRCRSDDRLHAEGAQHEHLGRAGVRRAALPPAGTRRARHLRLRQTLPVRSQLRLQRLGELRRGQTFRILPVGGRGLGDFERAVLEGDQGTGQPVQTPRFVRAGRQRRDLEGLCGPLPLPHDRRHGTGLRRLYRQQLRA